MDAINITHFVSPYKFWYSYVKDAEFHHEQVTHIEKCFAKQIKRFSPRHIFKVGDKVVLMYFPFSRYIRGEIINVDDSDATSIVYVVWAFDYGFPICTSAKHLKSLPTNWSASYPDYIKYGYLGNVIPAERIFCQEERRIKSVECDKWNVTTYNTIIRLIEESQEIYCVHNNGDSHGFSIDLEFQMPYNIQMRASDYLITSSLALKAPPGSYMGLTDQKFTSWKGLGNKKVFKKNIQFDEQLYGKNILPDEETCGKNIPPNEEVYEKKIPPNDKLYGKNTTSKKVTDMTEIFNIGSCGKLLYNLKVKYATNANVPLIPGWRDFEIKPQTNEIQNLNILDFSNGQLIPSKNVDTCSGNSTKVPLDNLERDEVDGATLSKLINSNTKKPSLPLNDGDDDNVFDRMNRRQYLETILH